jgi:hypothetical protein
MKLSVISEGIRLVLASERGRLPMVKFSTGKAYLTYEICDHEHYTTVCDQARYTPGKALNTVKKLVAIGKAFYINGVK